ncbi:glycosyltransferase family 4 protein [bacterium]|nr:glycosyltransferase family 4 protein [bacterium]
MPATEPAVLHLDTGRLLRGGQRQVLLLMRALRERGWRCVLAAPVDGALCAAATAEAFECFGFAPRGDLDLLAAWRLRREAAARNLELWHAHSARAQAQASLALAWPAGRERRRLVVTRRTAFPRRPGLAHRLKYGDRRIGRYLAISEAVASGLQARGVSPARIRLVPSAVDAARFAAAAWAQLGDAVSAPANADPSLRERLRAQLCRELALPPAAYLVGAAGALDASKGYDLLLRAAYLACREEPRLHVLVAGEGPERSRLEEETRRLGMGGRFRLLGRRHDLPDLFAALDLFCMPSREEGLGSVVLEAFAAGLPVLASDAGGLAELVQPGVSGRRVPRGDARALAAALLEALREPERSRELARAAHAGVRQRFSVERMVEAVEDVYGALLGERAAQAEDA